MKPMKYLLAAIAACLLAGCGMTMNCFFFGVCGGGADTLAAQKTRALSTMQNGPGMEYCEVTHGVDAAQLELCIRDAPDEATIDHSCIRTQERYEVIEGCMYMAKTINQSKQRTVNCNSNSITGVTCQQY